MADDPVSELTLSRIWQDGRFSREMRSVDGRRVSVVYGGVWTHQDGPDFRDALVDIDARLLRGAIELHVHASDWVRHRHQFDPAYDDVILHVVAENDLPASVTGPSGVPIPTIVFTDFLQEPLETLADRVFVSALGSLGKQTCLPTLAGGRLEAIHEVLRTAGWKRMNARRLRMTQELERLPPGEVLYGGLLDGFGLMQNRVGMAALAERLPLTTLESLADRTGVSALSMLLRTGGFLPLSPLHAELAGIGQDRIVEIERCAEEIARFTHIEPLSTAVWTLNRVRPQNHPVRRLASMASLIASSRERGLLSTVLGLPLDGGWSWRGWLETARPSIGRGRADQIAVNVLASFMAAYADAIGDTELLEQVGELWEVLPGSVDDSVAKSTLKQIVGQRRFRVRPAIEVQGLHEIGRNGCRQLRCFECPIAGLALMYEDDCDRLI